MGRSEIVVTSFAHVQHGHAFAEVRGQLVVKLERSEPRSVYAKPHCGLRAWHVTRMSLEPTS